MLMLWEIFFIVFLAMLFLTIYGFKKSSAGIVIFGTVSMVVCGSMSYIFFLMGV